MVTQVKRMRIESNEMYVELFGREDSDDEFYIDDDEVEGFAEIDKDRGFLRISRIIDFRILNYSDYYLLWLF